MHIDVDVQDFCQLVICTWVVLKVRGLESGFKKKQKGIKKKLLGIDEKYCDNGKIFSWAKIKL